VDNKLTENQDNSAKSTEAQDNSAKSVENSLTPALAGTVVYDKKASGTYGKWLQYVSDEDGTVHRVQENLGKVIDKQLGIFLSKKRGYYSFTLENGFCEVPPDFNIQFEFKIPQHLILEFGDIWMIDQSFRQIGLSTVLDELFPDFSDTLKALVSFRTLEEKAYRYASIWYASSYASVLYPKAKLDSPRISEFHEVLGKEENYRKFFQAYLNLIGKINNIDNKISLPILIDSTGLQNDIKTYITALNNHNGEINNEIRLIYVVDKKSKLPIYFRYVAGNIIDNSTLINTINMLAAYKIEVELVITEAGYTSSNNLSELVASNISFITKMTKNRKEYKELMEIHGTNLKLGENAVTYGDRVLYGKKVTVNLYGKNLFAYLMLDIQKAMEDEKHIVQKYVNESDKLHLIDENINLSGKFILLSTDNYDIKDILPLYYTRQEIEQVFDVSKTYASILPLRGHSEETIRGILMISFIATIIYSSINFKLFNSKYCANLAMYIMKRLHIEIFDSSKIVKELDKDQNQIFKLLGLDCPFTVETGNPLKKDSLITAIKTKKGTKRGRPKGSKNKTKKVFCANLDQPPEGTRRRGRPKGSKNRGRAFHANPAQTD
jgi:hypothetical protein